VTEGEGSPSMSDRALVRAILTWGGDFSAIGSRLSESWQERIETARREIVSESPEETSAILLADHQASVRPDFSRIHPTWLVRALRSESGAVQRTVTAHSAEPIRSILRKGLDLTDGDLATDREPDAEAVRWATKLWSERLVGDVAEIDSDPTVVVALTRLEPKNLFRLVKVCGLVKHAFTIEGNGLSGLDETLVRFTDIDRVRLGFFKRHIGVADPKIVALARKDFPVIQGDRRRGHALMGLVTLSRLLGAVEPHRSRWALQHLPYPIARVMRAQSKLLATSRSIVSWEKWVIDAAWWRLQCEARLPRSRTSRTQGKARARS